MCLFVTNGAKAKFELRDTLYKANYRDMLALKLSDRFMKLIENNNTNEHSRHFSDN